MRLKITVLAGVLIGCQASPPNESSTAQEVVVLVPPSYDFGSLQVGAMSSPFTITVAPANGPQDDFVEAVAESCPDFDVVALGLPAEVLRVCEIVTCFGKICPDPNLICPTDQLQTYDFNATFHPTVAGPVSCVITVTTTDRMNTRTITLTGTGTAPPIQGDVQPRSVAFGDVRRNTDSSAAKITVSSTGSQALVVSSVSISAGFAIASGPTSLYQLAPNTSQDYAVVCHPTAVGSLSGQLTVASNDPKQPSVTVPLTCKGIDSNLDITPSPAALPTTRVGEPIDLTIDLQNTGAAPMSLDDVAIMGTGITMTSVPPAGTMLAPGTGVAHVGVHFDAAAKGDVSGSLVASYDAGQRRTTQISARALATSMALTPDGDIDFGPVCAGQRKTQQFTLIANDQGTFLLEGLSDPGPPFTISPLMLPLKVLGAGATQVKFQVTAAPTDPGVATAQVKVQTDIPSAAEHVLNLSVEGLAAGVTATPDAVDLGSKPINTTTIGQSVHLSNCGTSPITFTNPRIEGADALDFAIVAEPTSSMIAPAGLASWLIVLQAHTVGVKQASFTVDYDGGTASIALQGEGLGDTPATAGRGSYYACSTGQPIALWPLAVALALVLRRRRR